MKFRNILITIFLILQFTGTKSQTNRDIKNHFLYSDSLSESRLISVATPCNYNFTMENYPVLYILDAEYVFNYALGAVDFLTNPFGKLPEMIIVGIPNTDRNRDLFVTLNPDDGFMNFIKFIEFEVIPYININYKTNGFDILYGWSSASGICTYFLPTNPRLFDGYIQSGTGIGPKAAAFMKENMALHNYENIYLYANTESEGPRVAALNRYKETIEELKPKGLRYKFEISNNPNHVEMLPQGLYDGLNFIFSDFYIPDSVSVNGTDSIISYFEKINNNYNFNVKIPLGTFNESATLLVQENKNEEAIKLLLFGTELYPEAPDLFASLAEIYERMGNLELASEYYKIAMKKSTHNLSGHHKYKILLQNIENNRK